MRPEIVTFWHGPLDGLRRLCLRSQVAAGHKVTIYSFDPIARLPDGVGNAEAEAILPHTFAERLRPTGPDGIWRDRTTLQFSDFFRMRLMARNTSGNTPEGAGLWLDADILPVMSLSIGEAEMPALHERNLIGHMVAWNYLHSIDTPENRDFIGEWRAFTGDPAAVTNDPMEASWIGFQLWTQSVQAAGTTEPQAVRRALAGRTIRAPSGFDVRVDPENQHLHKPAVIGRMDEKNFIWPVWASPTLLAPEPWSRWLPDNAGAAVDYAQSA